MNAQKRRAVSYIAGRLVTGKKSGAVYDYTAAASYRIYGDVSPEYIQVYDDERYGYIRGGLTPAGFALFDAPARQNIQMRISDNDFYGYDYETSSYFSGDVNKSSVNFFDFQFSRNYRYALQ